MRETFRLAIVADKNGRAFLAEYEWLSALIPLGYGLVQDPAVRIDRVDADLLRRAVLTLPHGKTYIVWSIGVLAVGRRRLLRRPQTVHDLLMSDDLGSQAQYIVDVHRHPRRLLSLHIHKLPKGAANAWSGARELLEAKEAEEAALAYSQMSQDERAEVDARKRARAALTED